MTRKTAQPSSRVHILIFDDDRAFIERRFGRDSASRKGLGETCRDMIHLCVMRLKAKENALRDASTTSQQETAQ